MVSKIIEYFCLIFILAINYLFWQGSSGMFEEYIATSGLINITLLFLLLMYTKYGYLLDRSNFVFYSLNSVQVLFYRVNCLARRGIIPLFLIANVSLLFKFELDNDVRLLYFVSAVAQQVFTILVFILIYDFLVLKGYQKHINTLPVAVFLIVNIARYNQVEILYLLNPFGGWMNLTAYFYLSDHFNMLFVLIPPVLFASVVWLYKMTLRNWV